MHNQPVQIPVGMVRCNICGGLGKLIVDASNEYSYYVADRTDKSAGQIVGGSHSTKSTLKIDQPCTMCNGLGYVAPQVKASKPPAKSNLRLPRRNVIIKKTVELIGGLAFYAMVITVTTGIALNTGVLPFIVSTVVLLICVIIMAIDEEYHIYS